jgi:hypothetical protein
MQRSHRTYHRWAWLLLTPMIAVAIMLALGLRVPPPVNDHLPTLPDSPASTVPLR